MAQFTAIRGRKIPNDEYKVGANFSTIISTSCERGDDGDEYDEAEETQIHTFYQCVRRQDVLVQKIVDRQCHKKDENNSDTKTGSCLHIFDTARYEHIPRKYAKIILSTNIDFTNKLKYSIISTCLCRYFS